ncbi:Gfo/Idh/MocA family oxidoreductase [Jannaschia sp. LMIT008]|uniref:Gfo/Idh/MocA family protein n=1 Tax=Jannaschia maritima TaxID=3032585 RepID=UPI002810E1D8|nr:Gfo/Idh/MocA family oxidoreductase [Jannaschia sp. LMIT008]
MAEIGIGVVGGGYMGKAHSVAMAAVGAVFDTPLRPRLEMIAASTDASAERYRAAYGFARGTGDWRVLVSDPAVEAVVCATPQVHHRAIVEACAAAGKPVLCEKPLGASLDDAMAMTRAVADAGVVAQVGFNYVRTPATQFARSLVADGTLGQVTFARIEMTEDFFADPDEWAWRAEGDPAGCLGDLAPHPINLMLTLMGPVDALSATLETVHPTRAGRAVTNDDQVQMMLRFTSGSTGHLFASRTALGRKMGYAYDLYGTKGSLRFDGEDQNSVHLYRAEGPEALRGFARILTGPEHPDYLPFCQGPGHGTGYGDQIVIEAKDFLRAIHAGQATFPTFEDGLEVARVAEAARRSHHSGGWISMEDIPR